MSRRAALAAALLAVLLGTVVAYLAPRLQPYTETMDHGPSPGAKANPYLAAEGFLRGQGLAVQRVASVDALETLPTDDRTVLLLGDRQGMSPRQADETLRWAAAGGHLVFVAERLYDPEQKRSGDLLLDRLQIQQLLTDDLDDQPSDPEDDPASARQQDDYPQLTKLYLENEAAPAYIGFDPAYHLYDTAGRAEAWANDAHATHMLQLAYGQGLITVLTDPWIWRNERIASYDNAWLLWYLTQDSAVTLVYRADHPSLAALAGRHFPEALAALALLVLLALWHAGMRHGPLVPAPSRARRRLEEHLHAAGGFLLRHRGQHHLLRLLQRDIRQRAARLHPGFERLAVVEQWQALGRLSRMPSSAIGQAMRPPPARRLSDADFTRQVAHLQTLRNAL
jgi:hypothetical protein